MVVNEGRCLRPQRKPGGGQKIKQPGPPLIGGSGLFPPLGSSSACHVDWHLIFRFSTTLNFRKVWRLLGVAEKIGLVILAPDFWTILAIVRTRISENILPICRDRSKQPAARILLNIYCNCADGLV